MSSCLYAIQFKDGTWKIGGSYNLETRLVQYKGPCKPIHCIVQIIEGEYRNLENVIIEEMNSSQEWELSDGREYFAPRIDIENAKQWFMQRFRRINPLPLYVGNKKEVCLSIREYNKAKPYVSFAVTISRM